MKIPIEKQKFITLTLTNSCNLRCSYCYEAYKNFDEMSLDKAIEIIDKEFESNDGYEQLNFQFFGGEPFLKFDTMKGIVKYLKQKETKKHFKMDLSTNGTLVHGRIQEWLKDNPEVVCGLSLDGNKEIHNRSRDNSFDKIDLDFFKTTYVGRPIKMTIAKENLPYLFEGIKFCHEQGFNIFCNLAYGIDWSDSSNIDILNMELNKLIDYYLSNPNIVPCSMLADAFTQVAYQEGSCSTKNWCAAGTQLKAYDTDGKEYPCQFFMPLSSGSKSKESGQILFTTSIPDEKLDEKCRQCIIKSACPTCYGSNYVSTGNIYQKEENYCKLTKIIVKARSYLLAKKWEAGLLKLSENEEKALIKSVLLIQEKLDI